MTSGLADRWTFWDRLIQSFRYRKANKLISEGCILVDCGCGKGDFLRHVGKKIDRGYGVDAILKDVEREEKFIFLGGNLDQKIPLDDESADVVTALSVLEHLEYPHIFIKEIFRILRTGGFCVLTTPSPVAKPLLEFLAYRIKIISEKDIRDHKKYYNQDELERLFDKFTDLRISYFLFGLNTMVIAQKTLL